MYIIFFLVEMEARFVTGGTNMEVGQVLGGLWFSNHEPSMSAVGHRLSDQAVSFSHSHLLKLLCLHSFMKKKDSSCKFIIFR